MSLPKTEYISAFCSAFRAHMAHVARFRDCVERVFADIAIIGENTFDFLRADYEQIAEFGNTLVNGLAEFEGSIAPIYDAAVKVLEQREQLEKALACYKKEIFNVRGDETSENVQREKEALMDFIAKLKKFNNEANSLISCFQSFYIAAFAQLESNLSKLQSFFALKDNMRIRSSDEEIELGKLIEQLNDEISNN